MMKPPDKARGRSVGASELAQMGVCERLVVFEALYGKSRPMAQRASMARGEVAHRRFYEESLDDQARRGRCYIATLVYGEGSETLVLRRFRERLLRPYRIGRWLIRVYQRSSPRVCLVLAAHPVLVRAMRLALRPLVCWAERWLERAGRAHAR